MKLNKFKSQNYYKLKSDCKKKGNLFVDNLFPANDSILFKAQSLTGVEWKRPYVSLKSYLKIYLCKVSNSLTFNRSYVVILNWLLMEFHPGM